MAGKATRSEPQRVSVRDANQGFSRLISRVEKGESFIVTKNGHEVARIEPATPQEEIDKIRRRQEAWARIEGMMRAGYRSRGGWTYKGRRDELHERDV